MYSRLVKDFKSLNTGLGRISANAAIASERLPVYSNRHFIDHGSGGAFCAPKQEAPPELSSFNECFL
jgi:hypothetical protein